MLILLKRNSNKIYKIKEKATQFSGIVVRVPGYKSRSPGSSPGATRFSEE
jgi:hypothetical protein